VEADLVAERALAALLAEVFADCEFWRLLALADSAGEPSAVLAERAVDIYLMTGRFPEGSAHLDFQSPAARAVGLLREIADVAAAGAYARERVLASGVEIPPRSAFARFVRLDEVDEWASELGHRVSVGESAEFPDEAWPRSAPEDRVGIDEFLEAWALVAEGYGRTLDRFAEGSLLRERWAEAVAESSESIERFRRGGAEALFGARGWLGWVRRNLPTEAEPLAVAGVIIPQTLFVLGWRPPEEALVPSPAYLSALLRDSDALDWLTEQGGEPPQWLVDA
jgi:hypothetical protein